MPEPKRSVEPFDVLLQSAMPLQLLEFFNVLGERLAAAFANAARVLPDSRAPTAKQVRGTTRRHYMNLALHEAAAAVGLQVETMWTDPPTWSFPVVKIGGFTLTLGVIESRFRGAPRKLRSKSKFVQLLCERNAPLNPQSSLFEGHEDIPRLIPTGALGALLVAQFQPSMPDVPAFLGFWVPSENLSEAYYVRSFDEITAMLRDRLGKATRRPRKPPVRKKVVIKRPRKLPPEK